MRDNRPWCPAGGLPDGGYFSDMKEIYAGEEDKLTSFDDRLLQLEYEERERHRVHKLYTSSVEEGKERGSILGSVSGSDKGRAPSKKK